MENLKILASKMVMLAEASRDNFSEAITRIKEQSSKELRPQEIFNWIYAFVGVLAVGYLIYAGINFILARGEPAKVKQAASAIVYALVGLALTVLAAAVTHWIFIAVGAG